MRFSPLAVFGCILSFTPLALAQSGGRLEEALGQLEGQREQIAQEKIALGSKLTAAEKELIALRRQATLARMSRADRAEILRKLQRRKRELEADAEFTYHAVNELGVALQAHTLDGHQHKMDNLETLKKGVSQVEALIGGDQVSGEAVAEDGTVKQGKFAVVGPAVWFLADDQSVAGAVQRSKTGGLPSVRSEEIERIAPLFKGEQVSLAVDVTGGKATALEKIKDASAFGLLRKGGYWLVPILGVALLATVCAIMKMIQLLGVRDPKSGWIAGVLESLRAGNDAQAAELAGSVKHPAAEVLAKAVTYAKAGPDVVEEVIYEQLIGVQSKLQSWLPFIAVTAATAPLLGLLGTVSGMIRMFNVITVTGTGDVKPMAGGISEALVTTLFGLIVAIPALVMHSLLSRRCQGILQNTEKFGLTLVNGLRKKGDD